MIDANQTRVTVPDKTTAPHLTVGEASVDFTRMLAVVYVNMDSQIALADTKAQLIIGANTLLAASLVINREAVVRAFTNGSGGDLLAVAMTVVIAVLVVMSIYYALSTARPNLASSGDQNTRNLFFFQHIAALDEDAYIDRFMDMSMNDIKRTALAQIHAKSRVAEQKFRNIRASLTFLFLALVLWLISRLILALVV